MQIKLVLLAICASLFAIGSAAPIIGAFSQLSSQQINDIIKAAKNGSSKSCK